MTSSYHESFERKNKDVEFDLDGELQRVVDETKVTASRFEFRLGRVPISLSRIEFKIIRFLSEKPYKAFRRDQIVQAVQSDATPITDDELDEHIRTLRAKLGLFSDYVQTVPYIGFRFKP